MRNLLSLNKIALTVAVAGALTLTGCASKTVTAEDAPAPSTVSSSTATAPETPTVGETSSPLPAAPVSEGAVPASAADSEPWPLHAASTVKAGTDLHVWGETLAPGSTATIHGAEQMAPASYDAATDMYTAAEEVIVTPTITVTADSAGKYDAQLPIPAGTKPQLLNIVLVLPDGGGNLVMTTVE